MWLQLPLISRQTLLLTVQAKNDLKITNPMKCGLSGYVKPRIIEIKLSGWLQSGLVPSMLLIHSSPGMLWASRFQRLQSSSSCRQFARWVLLHLSSIFQSQQGQQTDLWCKKQRARAQLPRGVQLAQYSPSSICVNGSTSLILIPV